VDSSQLNLPPAEFINVVSPRHELAGTVRNDSQMSAHVNIFHSAIFAKQNSEVKEQPVKNNRQSLMNLHSVMTTKVPFKHMKNKSVSQKNIFKINIVPQTSRQRTNTIDSDRKEVVSQRTKTERGFTKMTLVPDAIQRVEHEYVENNQLLSIKQSGAKLKKTTHHLFRNFQSIG